MLPYNLGVQGKLVGRRDPTDGNDLAGFVLQLDKSLSSSRLILAL
jgi:hypothetical protein